tara:strand:+ start:1295 stop:2431 length:1137 start_codon:yes stop_codon:yes gene_type:complete
VSSKLFERAARAFFTGGRDTASKNRALNIAGQSQFTGPFGRFIKDQSVKQGFMKSGDTLSKKTGLKIGQRQRDYQDPEFLLKLSESAKNLRGQGIGANLTPFNIIRSEKAANNPSLVSKGLEADVKTALGTPRRDDLGILKGTLSQYRSDLGYYDLTKPQMKDLLSSTNVNKYVSLANKYKTQLNKTVKDIKEFKGDNKKKLGELMTDYTYLVKGSDPNYWFQRSATFGHPSPIAANLEHYFQSGSQTSKMLARDAKFLTKMQPELGPLNIAKETLDRGILAAVRNPDNQVTKQGLAEMRKLFDMSGIQSILPGQIYQKMYLGTNNPELQMEFLRKAINVGSKPFGKMTQRDIQNIMFGKKKISDFGFFRGGIASLLE